MELVLLSCHDPVPGHKAVARRMVQAALVGTSRRLKLKVEIAWARLAHGVLLPRLRFSS